MHHAAAWCALGFMFRKKFIRRLAPLARVQQLAYPFKRCALGGVGSFYSDGQSLL